MYPAPIQQLIEQLQKLPTVGPRTAARFALHLVRARQEERDALESAIHAINDNIALCRFCFQPYEKRDASSEILCTICRSPQRQKSHTLCIVEGEADAAAIEDTGQYKGLYFVLGGTVDRLQKEDIEAIRVKELTQRVRNPGEYGLEGVTVEEVIIATNPTTEGEATRLLVERELSEFSIQITRLGRGLPVGGELEYADEATLTSALEGRH